MLAALLAVVADIVPIVATTGQWPTTLPDPTPSGYSIAEVDQVLRTDMEAGTARARRRTSARNDRVSLSWEMSDAQYVIFRAWFNDSTTGAAGGAAWVQMKLPVGSGGLTQCSVRFSKAIKADYLQGFYWMVSSEVEVRYA